MKLSTGQMVVGAVAIGVVGYFAWDWWKNRKAPATPAAAGAFTKPSAPAVAPASFWSSTLAKTTSGALAQSTSWGARGTGSAEQPEDLYGAASKSFSFSV